VTEPGFAHREPILFIDLGSDYGGVETYLKNLGCMLTPYAQGYALLSLPKLAAELRAQGMTVVCLPILGSKWLKALRLLLAAFVIPYMLLRYGIRTVQLNGFFESLLLGPLRLSGCTTLFTMHNPFQTDLYSPFRNPERWVPRFLSKHSLRFASQVICVSEAVASVARSVLPDEKVRVIPNWVDSPVVTRGAAAVSRGARLLFVGRLEEYKGVQDILQAMRQMPPVSLVVVGEGSYRPQLEAAAHGLDVRFAGFHADPSPFYKHATVFINPSLGPEGLPLVSLEAMAYKLPCVFSDLPVHLEITGGGQAASIFKRGDTVSLAGQLMALLESETLQRHYSLAGREAVEQHYSFTSARQAYLRAFGLVSA
jgi:glycosyltransferase involved in cell wall biosynthesis